MNLIDLKERIALSKDFSPEEVMFLLDAVNESPMAAEIEKHSPPNYLGRIDRLWAYLSIDEGGEGVCSATAGAVQLPLIAADKRRLDELKPYARSIAKMFKKPVRLARFDRRTDMEIFQP